MISKAHANTTLGYEFGNRTFTPPSSYKLRLSLTSITNGTGYTEPNVSTGYVPLTVANNTDTWTAPVNGIVTNAIPLVFDTFTAGLPLDTQITDWFITDTLEAGADAKYWATLDDPRPVIKDAQIWINIGELKLERTNLP